MRSSGIGMDKELLFVAGGGVKGKHRLAALLVVRAGFLGVFFFGVVCGSLLACGSVMCVSGVLVFVNVELLFRGPRMCGGGGRVCGGFSRKLIGVHHFSPLTLFFVQPTETALLLRLLLPLSLF